MTVAGRITPDLRQIHVPDELRGLKGWLVWRFVQQPGEPKPRKVPHYITGERRQGKAGGESDRKHLTDFEHAREVAVRKGYDGVGLALMPEFGLLALDFDDCFSPDGNLHRQVADIVANTYAEVSPSGAGVRAFFRSDSDLFSNKKSHKREGFDFGFEVFHTRGFVTFTGNTLPEVEILGNENTIAPVVPEVQALYEQRFRRQLESTRAGAGAPIGLSLAQIRQCLRFLNPDCSYDEWLQVGMIIHLETGASDDGLDIWDEWSSHGSTYQGRDDVDYKWRSFGHSGGDVLTGASLVRMANENGAGINLNAPASPDEFEDLVGAAVSHAEAEGPRFRFEPVHQFSSATALPWIVKGVLPRAGLAVVYGASGSGKSFAVLDMCFAIARGQEWRGKRVKQGRVAYIAAEGAEGFRKRLAAYAQHHGVDLSSVPMTVLNAAPNLMELKDAKDLAAGVRVSGGADVVVVDTFAQTTPGANENAGEDMGLALGHCKRLHEATGALVVLIHHSGKDASKGARGWSGLRAAADAELEIVREGDTRAIRLSKSKDGEDGQVWGFALEVVQLGVDEDLDPITSCVVVEAAVPVGGVPVGGVPGRKLGAVEKVVNDVIQEFALAQTEGIEVAHVLAEAVKRLDPPADGKRDTRRMRVRRAIEGLCNGDDAPYWLGDDGCIAIC